MIWLNREKRVTGHVVNSNNRNRRTLLLKKTGLTNSKKSFIFKYRFGVLLDRQALTGHKCYFLIFMGVSAFFDVFFVENSE